MAPECERDDLKRTGLDALYMYVHMHAFCCGGLLIHVVFGRSLSLLVPLGAAECPHLVYCLEVTRESEDYNLLLCRIVKMFCYVLEEHSACMFGVEDVLVLLVFSDFNAVLKGNLARPALRSSVATSSSMVGR